MCGRSLAVRVPRTQPQASPGAAPRRERPRRPAAEQRDELAALQLIELHSIPPARAGLQDIELARISQRVLRTRQILVGGTPRPAWPDVPQLERLITDWVRATDDAKRKQLANEVQRVALDEVTYVPWGEWVQPTAFRKSVRDVLKFGAPLFWNVKVA